MCDMVTVIDNLVSDFYKEDLQNAIFSSEFAWVHYDQTAGGFNKNFSWVEDSNTEETSLLTHKPSRNLKDEIVSFDPLLYKVAELVGYRIHLLRVKVNLMLPLKKINPTSYNRPHIDHPTPNAKTLLYYVNDCDGDTVLFDKTYTGEDPGELKVIHKFTPKAGSAILFDSNRYHASSTPTLGKRSAINIIFLPYEDRLGNQEHSILPPLPSSFSSKEEIKEFFKL
jgi:hypothetical protein